MKHVISIAVCAVPASIMIHVVHCIKSRRCEQSNTPLSHVRIMLASTSWEVCANDLRTTADCATCALCTLHSCCWGMGAWPAPPRSKLGLNTGGPTQPHTSTAPLASAPPPSATSVSHIPPPLSSTPLPPSTAQRARSGSDSTQWPAAHPSCCFSRSITAEVPQKGCPTTGPSMPWPRVAHGTPPTIATCSAVRTKL